jgi:outer membrane protein assembly factor BamE
MKKYLLIPALLLATSLFTACSTYKMDIQQGNVIEQEALNNLRVGMSRGQVASLLGSPLMQDDFHQNRWDYVFYLKKPGQKTEKKSVAVIFNRAGSVMQIKK